MTIQYDTIYYLHWKTDRQAAMQFNLAHELKKKLKNVLNGTRKVKKK